MTTTNNSNARCKDKGQPIAEIAPQDLPAGSRIASWSFVLCAGDGCTDMDERKGCHDALATLRESGDRYGDDGGDSRADYYCATCVAKAWDCSASEALIRIREQKLHVKKR